MKTYTTKEIFYTLQGEGFHSGRAAVFLRFAGCNLWSGREADRSRAICQFCDTNFVGGRKFDAENLADAVDACWPIRDEAHRSRKFVVCTGGEPLLQLDAPLLTALRRRDFTVAIETNGTLPAPEAVDWICVSPKANAPLALTHGNELKVVFPQEVSPTMYENLSFEHFYVQPMDGPNRLKNTKAATIFCLDNPKWKMSLQTHKILQIA